MRRLTAVVGLAVVAAAWGCKPPPRQMLENLSKQELGLYFGNLNNEAELRKLDQKTPRRSVDELVTNAPVGQQYSDYVWNPDLVIVVDLPCERCGTKQIVPGYNPGKNAKVFCPTCGAGDDMGGKPVPPLLEKQVRKALPLLGADLTLEQLEQRAGKDNVRRMWEPQPRANEQKDPLKIKIRYVRRQWAYDAYGTVAGLTDEARTKGVADPSTFAQSSLPYESSTFVDAGTGATGSLTNVKIPPAPMEHYHYGGYHRIDALYIGEMEVEFDGATLKMLGQPKEDALRPWHHVRSLLGPQRYQTQGKK
jgi:hypothetical protein